MKSLLHWLTIAPAVLVFSLSLSAQTKPKQVTILKTDNSVVTGALVSLNEQRAIVRTTGAQEVSIPIDDVYELVFSAPATSARPAAQPPPTPPAVDPVAFARCLSAFQRIMSAIEIGVTYVAYRQELLEAKVALDQTIGSLPDGQQRTDLLQALEDLRVAADAWQLGLQNDGIPTKTDFYRSLNQRYSLGVDPKVGRKVDHSVLLKIIWAKASERLDHAMSLQP